MPFYSLTTCLLTSSPAHLLTCLLAYLLTCSLARCRRTLIAQSTCRLRCYSSPRPTPACWRRLTRAGGSMPTESYSTCGRSPSSAPPLLFPSSAPPLPLLPLPLLPTSCPPHPVAALPRALPPRHRHRRAAARPRRRRRAEPAAGAGVRPLRLLQLLARDGQWRAAHECRTGPAAAGPCRRVDVAPPHAQGHRVPKPKVQEGAATLRRLPAAHGLPRPGRRAGGGCADRRRRVAGVELRLRPLDGLVPVMPPRRPR